MISNITYRLSCFADYSHLKYNNKDMIAVLNKFNDVKIAPSLFPEIHPNGEMSQRMQFVIQDQEKTTTFTIASDRIDVNVDSRDKNGFANDTCSKIKVDILEYMKNIQELFSDRTALPYRLAWFTSYVYFEISDADKVNFRNKFLHEIDFFKENRLDDMIVRYAATRNVSIHNSEERINVITTISRYLVNASSDREVDGFQIDYDINTWQGNRRSRFDDESIGEFIASALAMQNELNKDILP